MRGILGHVTMRYVGDVIKFVQGTGKTSQVVQSAVIRSRVP